MRIGKVSESILKRSILKEIKQRRDEVILGAAVGTDCAILSCKDIDKMCVSTNTISSFSKDGAALAVISTTNNLASKGAEPIGIALSILLPERTREAQLKDMMRSIDAICETLNIQIVNGHTETLATIEEPIFTITAFGYQRNSDIVQQESNKLEQGKMKNKDIIITKWVGLEGTSILAKDCEERLSKKFSKPFINEAKAFGELLSVIPEAATAIRSGVDLMHDASKGGIFAALWESAERVGVGLEIDLRRVPIRQETIEICEVFGLNPYELSSSGSLVIFASNGNEVVANLQANNINAVVIGSTNSGNDRIILNGEEQRFLEPPKADELTKVSWKERKGLIV